MVGRDQDINVTFEILYGGAGTGVGVVLCIPAQMLPSRAIYIFQYLSGLTRAQSFHHA